MEGKALGKGLAALIPEKSIEVGSEGVAQIQVELIRDNTLQPRTNYDEAKLGDLKASIKEKGVLQPILVRKRNEGYEVIAGERRLRAIRDLGFEKIPAIVKDVSDQEAFVIALVENIQREELNPIEEAEAYQKLIEDFNYTQEAIAKSVGKDRSTISNLLRVLKLSSRIRDGIYNGQISVGHARALLGIENPLQRDQAYDTIIAKGLSVRDVEHLVQVQAKTASTKVPKAKDHEIMALEDDLQKTLGTKVEVMAYKKRGKVVIEYYSLDDLDRIIQLIKK